MRSTFPLDPRTRRNFLQLIPILAGTAPTRIKRRKISNFLRTSESEIPIPYYLHYEKIKAEVDCAVMLAQGRMQQQAAARGVRVATVCYFYACT